MIHAFDKDYWDRHWELGGGPEAQEARTATTEEHSRDAVVRALRLGQRPTR